MSVLNWGHLFVGCGIVKTHRALTDVRRPAPLGIHEAILAPALVSVHRQNISSFNHDVIP